MTVPEVAVGVAQLQYDIRQAQSPGTKIHGDHVLVLLLFCECKMLRFRQIAVVLLFLVSLSDVNAQRIPFVIPGNDSSTSVTSRANLLDAPAGKHGFVTTDGAHFSLGGKRIRFWGMNLCFAANFPDHAVADELAPHLAKLGVNAVRFHHMDNQAAPGGIWAKDLVDGKRVFDSEMEDRLDYFLAKLHENGIYADLNLHVSRELTPEEGFPKLVDVPWWAVTNKWVMYYDKDVQAKVKQYCRDLLTHQNPYRDNMRRVDDPGIALVEMLNENYFSKQGYDLYQRLPKRFQESFVVAWNEWLKSRYGTTAEMTKTWSAKQPELGDAVAESTNWSSNLGNWTVTREAGSLPRKFFARSPIDESVKHVVRFEPLAATELNHELQLGVNSLSTVKNQPLTLSYWVRSDAARSYQIELSSSAGGEWRPLGLFDRIEATPKWTKVTRVIIPGETLEKEVALRFSFGSSDVPIEFADATLRSGAPKAELPAWQSVESMSVAIPSAQSPLGAHTDMKEFMIETEIDWVTELKTFLKNDLGVKVPITASQINYHTKEVNTQLNDFVDLHNYWHHPMFPSGANWDPNRWTVGNEPMEADPTRSSWPANSLLMRTGWRPAGKPFTLSEWNYPEPSPFSSGCVPMAAALGALQDWDAIFFFDYDSSSQTAEDWNRDQTVNFFSFNGQPVKLATFSVFANVFLRGDLPTLSEIRLGTFEEPIAGTQALRFKLGVTETGSGGSLALLNERALSTPDGSLKWISDAPTMGYLQIDTPSTKGVWGTVADRAFTLEGLDLKLAGLPVNYATVVATSQSSSPLAESASILLLASTQTENADMGWSQDRTSVGTNWGEGPSSIVGVEGTVSIDVKQANWTVYALDGKGQRLERVPSNWQTGKLEFRLSPIFKTLWYELAAE